MDFIWNVMLFLAFKYFFVIFSLFIFFTNSSIFAVFLLILVFICAAFFCIWLGATFVGFVLLAVYVGAVLVFFLFVTMMLGLENFELSSKKDYLKFSSYFGNPFPNLFTQISFITFFCISFLLSIICIIEFFSVLSINEEHNLIFDYCDFIKLLIVQSNLQTIGSVLYTYFFVEFLTSALILLVAMLGVIVILFLPKQ